MSTKPFSLTYVDNEGEWFMVCDTYLKVVATTCNFLCPSDGAIIRVTVDENTNDMAIDELERHLNGLPDITNMSSRGSKPEGLDASLRVRTPNLWLGVMSIESIVDEHVQKTITVRLINEEDDDNYDRPSDQELREEEERSWREERDEERYEEWTAGGGKACGYCIDVCRCM
jgi:hypothetical protein